MTDHMTVRLEFTCAQRHKNIVSCMASIMPCHCYFPKTVNIGKNVISTNTKYALLL